MLDSSLEDWKKNRKEAFIDMHILHNQKRILKG